MCPKRTHRDIEIQRAELQGSQLKGSHLHFAAGKLGPERLHAWLKVIQLIGGKGGTKRSLHCGLLGSPLYFILILIFVLCSYIPFPSQEALLYISNSIGPYLIIDMKQIKPKKYNVFYIHTKYNIQPHKFSHFFNKYLLRTFMKGIGIEIVRISKINTGNLQQSEKVKKNRKT